MKIEIAGAGAGKTTKLAQKIIDRHSLNDKKIIYCVSFTNSSVNTIEKILKNYYGNIPSNIKISTIHSFLNSELISPYNFLLYGRQFHHISNSSLGNKPQYKNLQISRLETKGILHVESFSSKAKYIVCGKSNDNKLKKEIRNNIHKQLSNYFGALYVDEAQDIDKHFKDILIKFDDLGLDVEVIGDPKQDLKGYGFLPELLELYPEDITYIKESYRCPECHLNFSNTFVSESEKQLSPEKKSGTLSYFFESEINDLKKFIKDKEYDLKYIYQKHDIFDTHSEKNKDLLFNELKIILSDQSDKPVNDISILKNASKITFELLSLVTVDMIAPKKAIAKKFPYNSIEKSDYFKLLEALEAEQNINQDDKIIVKSIESVKGLGEKNCLFIASPSIIPYILGTKVGGKVGASLYVALTRSKRHLDILITESSEKKYGKAEIEHIFI